MKNLSLYIFIFILFSSCSKTQFDDYENSIGTADFSNYISVGNSFTQGFQDGGLHNEHHQQDNSYPAIMARQMGTSFIQPTVSGTGSGYMHLEYIDNEIEVIKAFDIDLINNDPLAINYDPSFANWVPNTVKYNNLGVGGINVRNVVSSTSTQALEYHILFGSGATAPLSWNGINGQPISAFGRFLEWGSLGNEIEYVDNVASSNATFFTNWLGINDAMAWAKEGGDSIGGSSAQTPLIQFRERYDTILDVFQAMGAQGICATVHDITETPFFTTITLEVVGKDLWIKEGADTTIVRLATEEDLLLLTAKDFLGDGVGLTQANPLPHTVVLDKTEVIIAKAYTNDINSQIRASAASHGYPVVDMYSFMGGLVSGMNFDGIALTTKYIEGGAYSLDGLHPNSKGYAMIANEFMNAINANFGSTLQPVSIGSYRGITFP